MSQEESQKSNNSHSESSSSSPSQTPFFREHIRRDVQNGSTTDLTTDLTLFGSPAPTMRRSGTIKRASSLSLQNEKNTSGNGNIKEEPQKNVRVLSRLERVNSFEQNIGSRYRLSLDSSFRRSLESISEHKTKRSFSPTFSLSRNSKYSSSLESFSSDQTDYATRSTTDVKEEKTIQSPASSYLSWIETVNSEFFESVCSETLSNDFDNKVGEWNNFWLNYNSARNPYLSGSYRSVVEKGDDNSDARSSGSTQKDISDRNSGEYISLSVNEVHEIINHSKKITEILQKALTRNDQELDNSNNENSVNTQIFSRQNSSLRDENGIELLKEDLKKLSKDRSPNNISSQDLINQKVLLKSTVQSSSASCINALLSSSVADLLKKVINKRRDVVTPDDLSSMTRRSFSEWSSK
ncbi:uncharacterized protein isoform X2 [Leptinotarsa decemlineata]|uniref:uncharacterized protein isoform X2 n=1 Tax=Leptinotarsa decemlineata TaxID=7539 RepID=UPI003D308D14